ncbi:unnamed protein product, partial [Protopolystoma xenopodis]
LAPWGGHANLGLGNSPSGPTNGAHASLSHDGPSWGTSDHPLHSQHQPPGPVSANGWASAPGTRVEAWASANISESSVANRGYPGYRSMAKAILVGTRKIQIANAMTAFPSKCELQVCISISFHKGLSSQDNAFGLLGRDKERDVKSAFCQVTRIAIKILKNPLCVQEYFKLDEYCELIMLSVVRCTTGWYA